MPRARDPKRWLPGSTRRPTRVYVAWRAMRQRCRDRRSDRFSHYGGRGITICPEWESFENFHQDMGEPPPGCSLERLDVNAPYSPSNCVWADPKTQANNKTSNHWLVYEGRRMTMCQWSEELGIPYSTLRARIRAGWSAEDALSKPIREVRQGSRGRLLSFRGEQRTLAAWSKELGIPISTLTCRLQRGWSVERSLRQSRG